MARIIRIIMVVLIVGAAFYLRFENPRMEPTPEKREPTNAEPASVATSPSLRESRLSGVMEDRDHRPLSYHLYIPRPKKEGETFPLLFCMDGLDPNPERFLNGMWIDFADSQRFAVAALSFLYKESEWALALGSTKKNDVDDTVLDELLGIAAEQGPVRQEELYLFGTSTGARYVVNYTLAHPTKVQAVVAHGGTNYAAEVPSLRTSFLLSIHPEDAAAKQEMDALAKRLKAVNVPHRLWMTADPPRPAASELLKQAREFLLESRKD